MAFQKPSHTFAKIHLKALQTKSFHILLALSFTMFINMFCFAQDLPRPSEPIRPVSELDTTSVSSLNNLNIKLDSIAAPTLNIKLADSIKNDSIPIEHCSGFEKFVISISIRIALSILSPTHSMNLMMIDEGFGVFDNRHNKQLLKMLEPLQSIFKQIFIITHINELQYEIPNKIQIKNGKMSYK